MKCNEQVQATKFTTWLRRGYCAGGEMHTGWDEPERMAFASSPAVGKHPLHPSHALVFFRGVWVCWTCRAYAEAGMGRSRVLVQPCKNKRLAGHRDARKMVLKGLHPKTGSKLKEKAEEAPSLQAGQQVAIAGLKTAAGKKLNGKQGCLMHFDEVLGRWHLRVKHTAGQQEQEEILAVRAACLVKLPHHGQAEQGAASS